MGPGLYLWRELFWENVEVSINSDASVVNNLFLSSRGRHEKYYLKDEQWTPGGDMEAKFLFYVGCR